MDDVTNNTSHRILGRLALQLEELRLQAERLGRLLEGRDPLECPACGLHEDQRADLERIVSHSDEPAVDTGLRFMSLDEEKSTWLCPGCGEPFAPPERFPV